MTKFKYNTDVVEVGRYGKYGGGELEIEYVDAILADRSEEGWELVSVVRDENDYVLFFKKEESK